MNRIDKLFAEKRGNLLSVYCTAGFPKLGDTVTIIKLLESAGADLIEIGIPFSDPLADGPVIQQSGQTALNNGMTLKVLFDQLKGIRKDVSIPLILMGYYNTMLQFGVEQFCLAAEEVGIDGLIIPDLPMEEYEEKYKQLFGKHNLRNVLLVTPRTADERIAKIDGLSEGFVYAVSSSSTTGNAVSNEQQQQNYFKRLGSLKLRNPVMIGFGISSHAQFVNACKYASGAIIGSAFIKHISQGKKLEESIPQFIKQIKYDRSA